MNQRMTFAILTLALLVACASGAAGPSVAPNARAPVGPTPADADLNILFMGNSHTTHNDVPGLVAALVRAAAPGRSVAATVAPGWMLLEERAGDRGSLASLRGRRWDYVVLQAQALSQSGRFSYPTSGAEQLVRMTRQLGAVPVLFAEWPRAGIAESQTIYDTYVSIARKEPACVAPIPQAFALARTRAPTIRLYADDGNHSSPAGALLASLVLAATMADISPGALPELDGLEVDGGTQAHLRELAAEAVQAVAPRRWCPTAPPMPSSGPGRHR